MVNNAVYSALNNELAMVSMAGVVNMDRATKQVTARAGTLLKYFNKELKRNGLAVANLPTLGDQTIGGALAVGKSGITPLEILGFR